MCGIAGFVLSPSTSLTDGRERLERMAVSLRHRGPDDTGIHLSSDGRVGLTNTRLAVIDLSSAGRMPMNRGRLWITYNGEIYNAALLKMELEAAGYEFTSRTDTEIVLRGYEAWGGGVVERLRGMFALAIYDGRASHGTRRLLLARDRLGIKPLYYVHSPQTIAFASELRALRASGFLGPTLSPAGIVGYLALGAVPSPWTIWDGARTLEPGSTLDIPIDGSVVTPVAKHYWSMPEPNIDAPCCEEPEALRALLIDAVKSHLICDAPIGAFLSGGVDSSAVVALAHHAGVRHVRTCSIVFEDAHYGEGMYARAVAALVDAEHHERVVTADDVRRELNDIVRAMDQPTTDGVNTYFVAKAAREAGLTVALSGLGADELFGGYPQTFRAVPRLVTLARAANLFPSAVPLMQAGIRVFCRHQRWQKLHDMLERSPEPAAAYVACRGVFSASEVRRLVGEETWRAATAAFDPVEHVAARAPCGEGRNGTALVTWVSRAELSTYLHDQLLRDTDVMSMAHSLEVRVPFLDGPIVERMLQLSNAATQVRSRSKPLLLDAVGDLLPPLVRDRRGKQGFLFPFDAWLRGPLKVDANEWGAKSWGAFNPAAMTAVVQAFDAGRLHWSRVWAIDVLLRWRQICAG